MKKSKIKYLESIFPILAVDDTTNVVVSKNADLTIGFSLNLPEVFTPSDSDYDTLHTTFVRALATLPSGYIVHKQDWFVEQRHQLNEDTKTYIANNNYLAYENELHFLERTYIEQRSYIFITRPTQEITRRRSLNSSLLKHHFVPKEAIDAKFWKEFLDTATQFSSILESTARIKCHVIKPLDWLGNDRESGLFQQYFTLSLEDTTLQDIQMKEELRVGGKYTQTFTLAALEDFPGTLNNAQLQSPI